MKAPLIAVLCSLMPILAHASGKTTIVCKSESAPVIWGGSPVAQIEQVEIENGEISYKSATNNEVTVEFKTKAQIAQVAGGVVALSASGGRLRVGVFVKGGRAGVSLQPGRIPDDALTLHVLDQLSDDCVVQ